jgi:hypothetical protein
MHTYAKIYQFAASVGALEGYVYKKESADDLGIPALSVWIDNICRGYNHLPAEALAEFQGFLDRTIGRAVHSLKGALGADHELVIKVMSIVKGEGEMPVSADDFNKKKWFEQ